MKKMKKSEKFKEYYSKLDNYNKFILISVTFIIIFFIYAVSMNLYYCGNIVCD